MATPFTFVDNSNIDRGARRAIRSHVMKGKNIGKVRQPRRPPNHLYKEGTEQSLVLFTDADKIRQNRRLMITPLSADVSMRSDVSLTPIGQLGDELSRLTSPFEISAQSRRSIHHFLCYVRDAIYPVEFCKDRPDPELSIWFQYAFSDEAFFHCFVALSEACAGFATGKETQSRLYSHHMASALRLINGSLSGPNALGDTNLATVTFFCLLSSISEQPLQTKLHFDGLCGMIDARGGIHELTSSARLIEKARRVEIDVALQLGCKTKLNPSAEAIDAMIPRVSDLASEADSDLIRAIPQDDWKTQIAAHYISGLVLLLSPSSSEEKLEAYNFQEIIIATCYRLLEIKPLNSSDDSVHPVADAIYLSLLSFMTTLLIQIGRQRYLRYDLLSSKLITALKSPEFQAAVDPATHLWILVIAGISVLGQDDFIWLTPRLTQVAERLACTEWGFLRQHLGNYPWISSVHDKPASHLWGLVSHV